MTNLPVRGLHGQDLDSVVGVHQAAFPGFLMTLLGPSFLRNYYRMVLGCAGGILLGQYEPDGQLRGFVAGFVNPPVFYGLLRDRKPRMLVAAASHLVLRPMLWPRVLENAGATSRRASNHLPGVAELASIGVLPGAQGRGYGRSLIAAFLAAAEGLGAHHVELTTDADQNDSVNRLYRTAGFQLVDTSVRKGGRRMNHYTISLAKRPASAPGED